MSIFGRCANSVGQIPRRPKDHVIKNHARYKIHSKYKADKWILMSEYEKLSVKDSDFTLQLIFKKLPYVEF